MRYPGEPRLRGVATETRPLDRAFRRHGQAAEPRRGAAGAAAGCVLLSASKAALVWFKSAPQLTRRALLRVPQRCTSALATRASSCSTRARCSASRARPSRRARATWTLSSQQPCANCGKPTPSASRVGLQGWHAAACARGAGSGAAPPQVLPFRGGGSARGGRRSRLPAPAAAARPRCAARCALARRSCTGRGGPLRRCVTAHPAAGPRPRCANAGH